uniref:DUF5641 domain-containing protein n=1 Tax=Heterorhabditis bacteriophora TaxID=37862 RepID=A0A1I7WUZ5_HETBA
MADKFWNDWNTRYLTELRRHGSRNLPEIGEVVLVENELTPRSTWYYGIVVEIIQGADGQVRSAKLKCPNGRILHRPINKLYPMEIRAIAPSQSIPTPAELGDPNLEEEVDEEEEERLVHTHQLEAEPTREYSSNVFINTKKYWPTKFSSNLPSLLSIISILSLVITEASETTEKIECIAGGFRLKHLRGKSEPLNNNTIQEEEEMVVLPTNFYHQSSINEDANATQQTETSASLMNSENDEVNQPTSFNIRELTITKYSTKGRFLLMIILMMIQLSSTCQDGYVRGTSNVICSEYSAS